MASFLAYSYFKIKNRRHCIFLEIKSPRLESRKQRTSCREILLKAVFCEMVPTPYKRVNVLSFEIYLIIPSFRLLKKSNILILNLKLLLQFVAALNTMGFRERTRDFVKSCLLWNGPYSVQTRECFVVWNISHNTKFSSFEKSNILILNLKLLLQFVAALNTMGFR